MVICDVIDKVLLINVACSGVVGLVEQNQHLKHSKLIYLKISKIFQNIK